MRFNSLEHLIAWRDKGRWPRIHDAMTHMALGYVDAKGGLLDVGCSYGLLGYRIAEELGGLRVIGLEVDPNVVRAAEEACVGVTFVPLRVSRETISDVAALVRRWGVDVLIARRVLPELWGDDLEGGELFAAALVEAGIKEALVEGRVATKNAVNRLSSIDQEVALLSKSFREVARCGAVSYLRAK